MSSNKLLGDINGMLPSSCMSALSDSYYPKQKNKEKKTEFVLHVRIHYWIEGVSVIKQLPQSFPFTAGWIVFPNVKRSKISNTTSIASKTGLYNFPRVHCTE